MVTWRTQLIRNLPGSSFSNTPLSDVYGSGFPARAVNAGIHGIDLDDVANTRFTLFHRVDPLAQRLCDLVNSMSDDIAGSMARRVATLGPTWAGSEARVASMLICILDHVFDRINRQNLNSRPTLNPRRSRHAFRQGGDDAQAVVPVLNMPGGRATSARNRWLILYQEEPIHPAGPHIDAQGGRSDFVARLVDQGQCVSRCVVEVKCVDGDISHGIGQCISAAAILGANENIDCVNGLIIDSKVWYFVRVSRHDVELSAPVTLTYDPNGLPRRTPHILQAAGGGGAEQGPLPGSLEEVLLWIVQVMYNWA